MFNSMQFADALAGAVASLRSSANAGDEQRAALRRMVDLSAQKSVTIRYYDNELSVDDFPVPLFGEATTDLVGQMQMHSVSEIVIGRGAEPAELLALIVGLAAGGGQGRIKERLRDADSNRVMVILKRASEAAPTRSRSITQAFERAKIEEMAKQDWNKFLSSSAAQAEDREVDLARRASENAGEIVAWPEPEDHMQQPESPPQPPPPPVAPPLERIRSTVAGRASGAARMHRDAPAPAPAVAASLPALKDGAMAAALEAVARDPYGDDSLSTLTQLGKLVEIAVRESRVADAMRALEAVIAMEQAAPSEDARARYEVVLTRTLKQDVVTMLVPSLTDPRLSVIATIVVRRGRDVSADLLLGLLAASDSVAERVACLNVLRGIPKGVDKALRLLRDSRWLVVRNVAEAVGELRLDAATPYLTGLKSHSDARVQRASIVALARIGSAATIEPLRATMNGGTPETRALIAGNIGGPQAAALVVPITQWIEVEKNHETVAEYCRALGRIGTPEAVTALARAAAPGGKVIARKSAAARLAAVEGLRVAGVSARQALEQLAADDDKVVREAAAKALALLATS